MATTPQFIQSTLAGTGGADWTSLQFGPDQRLYAAKVDGTIVAFTIAATSSGYAVVTGGTETINLVKNITNYNDDGTLAPTMYQGTRQVTGILVTSGAATAVASATADTQSIAVQDDAAATISGDFAPTDRLLGLADAPGQALSRVPAHVAT